MASWILLRRLVCMTSLMSKDSEINLHNISSTGLLMSFFQYILHRCGVTCIFWIFNEPPPASVLLHEAVYRRTFAALPLLVWFTSYLKLPHLLNIIPVQWLWNQVLTSCLIKIKMILCLTRKKTGAHKLGSELLIKSELLPFFLFVCLLLI